MSKKTVLSVENVSAGYGRNTVLDRVSIQLQEGDFLALLGKSGCGKTTLLRAIGGFITPTSGSVFIDGQDVTNHAPDRRPSAMVFQSYALWPHMTVHGNIAYGLKLRGLGKSAIRTQIDEVLSLLRLDGLADRKVTDLSGGQRQRVALGRALAVAPRLLLLDEPLSNLDARIRLDLRHEIRDLLKRLGITAVHVTHDREEAMVMADQLALLHEGKIVQQGSPKSLYDHPQSAFAADFMGASNVLRLQVVRGNDRLVLTGPKCAFPVEIHEKFRSGQGRLVPGPVDVYFRSAHAKLVAPDTTPDGAVCLEGQILQTTYPGDIYRYTLRVGDQKFIVDSTDYFQERASVRILLPLEDLHFFSSSTSDGAANQGFAA